LGIFPEIARVAPESLIKPALPLISMKPSAARRFNHKRPTIYVLCAKVREALLEKFDDMLLISVVKSRRGGKTVKVKLEDL
jgi:hypothetical protein